MRGRAMALFLLLGVAALGATLPAKVAATGPQAPGSAPVTAERLMRAAEEPHNWLTYTGSYASNQYSELAQIDRNNIDRMRVEWIHQFRTLSTVETQPVVADGLMVITESPSNVIALDAATGRQYWKYTHPVSGRMRLCCG